MFAGYLQIMWAHSHLIRIEGIGYLQTIRAEKTDVCSSYGLCLQPATDRVRKAFWLPTLDKSRYQ